MLKSCVVALVVLLGSSLALASPFLRRANFDPTAGVNHYEVVFPPELGGGTIFMPIVGGSLELETPPGPERFGLLPWSPSRNACAWLREAWKITGA